MPGQAGGGSVQKEKNYIDYIAKKEFAYRMCARQRAFCRFHGGDVLYFEEKCFDVLVSVAGSAHVMVTSFDAM